MAACIHRTELVEAVADSEGFSFAQLRESYILAAQFAFEEERAVTVTDRVLSAGLHDSS
jgi:hypothetical protein